MRGGSILSGKKIRAYIKVFDVALGDAIYIKIYYQNCKRFYLIDGGFSKYGDTIEKYIKNDKENEKNILNGIIITHIHADHIGGIVKILNNREIKINALVMTNARDYVCSDMARELYKCLEASDKHILLHQLQSSNAGLLKKDFPEFDFLYPTEYDVLNSDANKNSIITLLNVNNTQVLLSGDAYKKQELLAYHKREQCKVKKKIITWKLGHHGSSTSTRKCILNKLKDELSIAILSCPKGKEGIFPHEDTLKLWNKHKNNKDLHYTSRVHTEILHIEEVDFEIG